ncbi:MAG: 23S rRNA (adenine(2503)-C(2))-methyltransferase RlmN [Bacteroidales bacterium]|nr:23S rRNA (adenine(2503)-C(2))-methyltransferase RlmN [Bacteroidales bacterium]HOY39222.1 23S rRNA (adenine(2503)-C(2))-methyltransferase RlmN [Bacteroidales bacterium]HQP04978.1 23S rRNA (adenine(2503)-C(2))-methyltransferase RlmN [Bacteroidales bacterium]
MKTDIRKFEYPDIEEVITRFGESKFRAKQVYDWIWTKGAGSFEEMTSLSKTLRSRLGDSFCFTRIQPLIQQVSRDGTIKTGFRLHDSHIVEGVLIPSNDRATACISTQVGCAMNCHFCATGMLGFTRNLDHGEIFDQFVMLNALSIEKIGIPLSNMVVMGMGEPFLNFENLMRALAIISSPEGINFSPTRITVSTIGIPEKIRAFADLHTTINLSVSLHSAIDAVRSSMMPAAKKFKLSQIRDSIDYFYKNTGLRITYEYILFENINDDMKHAKALAEFCKISPCKINLIVYNHTSDSTFRASSSEHQSAFVEYLESKNLIVNIRRSKGSDIDAACGQLANKNR